MTISNVEAFDSFKKLCQWFTGEDPLPYGESFNEHFVTSESFIKVNRPWVKPHRLETESRVAKALHEIGLPVARPLGDGVYRFYNENGVIQYASFLERLQPVQQLGITEAILTAGEWINKVWEVKPPIMLEAFQLEDYHPGVKIRLASSNSQYASKIIDAVEEVVEEWHSIPAVDWRFIHGDLHSGNLLNTTDGLKVIDWESSCIAPKEWDAVQNIRLAPEPMQKERWFYWLEAGLNEELLKCFYEARTLSLLSHLVATNQKNPLYYRAIHDLGWD